MLRRLRRLFDSDLASEMARAPLLPSPLSQDDLDRAIGQIRGDVADLKLQWAEILDKIQRWASRQAKRDALDLKRRLESLEPGDRGSGDPSVPPPGSVDVRGLSKAELRHLAAQRGLLNRRA